MIPSGEKAKRLGQMGSELTVRIVVGEKWGQESGGVCSGHACWSLKWVWGHEARSSKQREVKRTRVGDQDGGARRVRARGRPCSKDASAGLRSTTARCVSQRERVCREHTLL